MLLFVFDWGDIATWFTGIVTLLALWFAFYQLHSDRKLNREGEIINQAENISAWIQDEGHTRAAIPILNNSASPVYNVIVKIVRAGQEITTSIDAANLDHVSFISVLPPGKYLTYVLRGYEGMSFRPAVEIAFSDSKGRFWIRGGNGVIKQLTLEPITYYGLSEPLSWDLPGERHF